METVTGVVKRSAVGIVATAMLLASTPAVAEDKITTQPYWEPYHMQTLRDEGLDGSGVKIGIIDSAPDLSVPELQGADIKIADHCKHPASPAETGHGTAVTSLLASPDYGMAPGASFTVYVSPVDRDKWPEECKRTGAGEAYYLINAALNDGMDIIVQTTGSDNYFQESYAVLRAADMGVPVVIAVANKNDGPDAGNADANGAVAVGGMDLRTNMPGEWSHRTPSMIVMAPGAPITVRRPDASGALTQIDTSAFGNSYAAPLVAGALALAQQKYPEANGNQLIYSMIATASQAETHDEIRGYGNARPINLVANDPMGYSTKNPIMKKFPTDQPVEGNLTSQEIADYRDGLVNPGLLAVNDPYVYRGKDEAIITAYPDRSEPGTSPRFKENRQTPSSSPSATSSTVPASPVPTDPTSEPAAEAESEGVSVCCPSSVSRGLPCWRSLRWVSGSGLAGRALRADKIGVRRASETALLLVNLKLNPLG